jgi:glyoxylase-like metal-dependent hydrolase (beta-lactamase superfamily II)/rhodanese-related sulfurtransferase
MVTIVVRTEREEHVMVDELVLPVVDDGLGNSSYLVDLGDGRALAVDPSRDLRALDSAAARHGLRVVAAADTHLHADFLSGATRLAARDGAVVYASAAGGRQFPHTGLGDGDEVDLGGLTLRAWFTPGHTGEHVAFLLADGDTVLGVFTGGSLLVGAAARTDLVAPEQTEPLARAQHASLRRLARLPDATAVWPTHGAGSFCSAPPGAERTTTIGRERATNPLLAAENEDAFVGQLLGSLGSFPPYFLRLAEVNRRGPPLPPADGGLPSLSPEQLTDIPGAEVIDVRPPAAYAGGHIRGSLAIPLRAQFATWLGWLVPDPGTPLVFVRDPNQDPGEIVWQARKIGYDNLVGELTGGVAAWAAAGYPAAALPLLDPAHVQSGQVDPARVLDIRQDREYAAGHLPAARHVELGALPAAALAPGPWVTMCGHGERATTAASVLERAARHDVAVAVGGPDDWAQATGTSLERRA